MKLIMVENVLEDALECRLTFSATLIFFATLMSILQARSDSGDRRPSTANANETLSAQLH